MALADDLEDIPNDTLPVQEPDVVEPFKYHAPKDTYDSIIREYDTSEDYSVLEYMEGSKWTVNYYNQNLGKDDSGKLLDSANPPALRPMTKVENLVLIVDSPMNENLYESMEGTAIFYAGKLRPYVGDNFVVPLLNKRLAIFQITSVKLKTYVNKDIYAVSYQVFLFNNNQATEDFLIILEQSVNRKFYFNSDFIRNRSSVLLTNEENNRYQDAIGQMAYLSRTWIQTFRDFKTNLFLINQTCSSMDRNLEKFFLSIIEQDDLDSSPVFANTTYSPFGGRLDRYTIFDLLLDKKHIRLDDICHKAVKLTCAGGMGIDVRIGDLSILGFNCIIFPYKDLKHLGEINLDGCHIALDFEVDDESIFKNTLLPDIVGLSKQAGTYLFNTNFYSADRSDLSTLELLILDYIEDRELDTVKLLELANSVNKFTLLEKFYYLPIIYLLLKYYKYYAYSFVTKD